MRLAWVRAAALTSGMPAQQPVSLRPRPAAFPRGFAWGVATAAAQIEGAAFEDGKGESVWDRFARRPGAVLGGETPDAGCDHYHRFREDIALMRSLGVKHYRFSVAWPRVIPGGTGPVNAAGLGFYDRLVDALLEADITPWVTIFHWDLPQALEDRGGWRVRATADAFAPYADVVVRTLGDRVKRWITLNEIRCFTHMGYGWGDKAPGANEPAQVIRQTVHHALLCHGHGVRAVREHGGRGARVGITDNPPVPVPVTETEADIAAARRWWRDKNADMLGAVWTGRYEPSWLKAVGRDRPVVQRGDFALIGQPGDFVGLNIYTGAFVRAGRGRAPYEELTLPSEHPRTASPWHAHMPQVLYWGPRLAHEVYGAPEVYITESGFGYDDEPVVAGEVRDLHRRDGLRTYLLELRRACTDGVPVKGFFLWSFLDNFEWQDGYRRRFGIVHVDFPTQVRTPKLSAHWYAEVMRRNAVI